MRRGISIPYAPGGAPLIATLPLRKNTLSAQVVPESWLTNVLLIVAGVCFVAISARFSYHFSFSTVPVTGQTFAVLLIGALFGSRLGAATMIAYAGAGAAGLPVFARSELYGYGGIDVIRHGTGGFILGFIVMAYIVGWFAERGWDRSKWIMLPMFLGNAVLYVPGLLWLHSQLHVVGVDPTWNQTLDWGLWPFIAGDLAKLVAAALAVPAGWSIIERFRGGNL